MAASKAIEKECDAVAGADSAGCVPAKWLSADARERVLTLEFGGRDKRAFIREDGR